MGFFDQLVQASAAQRRPRRVRPRPVWMKPEAAIGAAAPVELIIARAPDVAVVVSSVIVYPAGFEFMVSAMVREDEAVPMFPGQPDGSIPDTFLRVGVLFADGRSGTNLDVTSSAPEVEADKGNLVFTTTGGSGGMRRFDATYWVWPLPPDGPVTFVCEWPAHDVPESRASIDSQVITTAAGRSIQLWPEQHSAGAPIASVVVVSDGPEATSP
ncbi:hypothetical protein AB0M47_08645 [Hamadaea sp. NPDC051192]|uniref:hypothetical protein n=1 Tax=Hamadaea sp. NPDC051192 TaxID=3154940 RepID=UPI00341B0F4C